MQAPVKREKQLVAKDQRKMFTFGLKVAFLQKCNDVCAKRMMQHKFVWRNILVRGFSEY